jgi:hypothetical protein
MFGNASGIVRRKQSELSFCTMCDRRKSIGYSFNLKLDQVRNRLQRKNPNEMI